MEYLCLDIKYVKVEGEGRNYYQLAVIDVFSLDKLYAYRLINKVHFARV
jgi:hypothetical protein